MSQEIIQYLKTIEGDHFTVDLIKRHLDSDPGKIIQILQEGITEDEESMTKVIGIKGIELLKKATV